MHRRRVSHPPSMITVPSSVTKSSFNHHHHGQSTGMSLKSQLKINRQRWLPVPCGEDCPRHQTLPKFPIRQESYKNADSCCSSDSNTYTVLSECEKYSQEISDVLQGLQVDDDESPEEKHLRDLGESDQSLNSSSMQLPRMPHRQMSFGNREKRWSASTADGSWSSLPFPSTESSKSRSSLTSPKKPRRQLSNV